MKRIISGYEMELYALQRSSFTSYPEAECLPPDLKLTLLDDELLDSAKTKWPNKYKQWRSALENSGKTGGRRHRPCKRRNGCLRTVKDRKGERYLLQGRQKYGVPFLVLHRPELSWKINLSGCYQLFDRIISGIR